MSFSIRELLIGITVIAVALVGFTISSTLLATTILACVHMYLFIQPAGAILRTGRERAFWLGSMFCGFGFLLLDITRRNEVAAWWADAIALWMTDGGVTGNTREYLKLSIPLCQAMVILTASTVGGLIGARVLYREPGQ